MDYDPFDELRRLRDEMDRVFTNWNEQYFLPQADRSLVPKDKYRIPQAHVFQTESSVIADIELPGVEKKDIDLKVNDQSIELRVQSKQETKAKTDKGSVYSATSQSYYRYIPLPCKVIADKADAEFKNGLLRVTIPKIKEIGSTTKRLQIR